MNTDTHPVKQRNGVEYKWKDERSRPQNFTPLWELQLQEPVRTNTGGDSSTTSAKDSSETSVRADITLADCCQTISKKY